MEARVLHPWYGRKTALSTEFTDSPVPLALTLPGHGRPWGYGGGGKRVGFSNSIRQKDPRTIFF